MRVEDNPDREAEGSVPARLKNGEYLKGVGCCGGSVEGEGMSISLPGGEFCRRRRTGGKGVDGEDGGGVGWGAVEEEGRIGVLSCTIELLG